MSEYDFRAESRPLYRVCGPNGRKLFEGEDEYDVRKMRDLYAHQARGLGLPDDTFTVKVRHEVVKMWIGDWEEYEFPE